MREKLAWPSRPYNFVLRMSCQRPSSASVPGLLLPTAAFRRLAAVPLEGAGRRELAELVAHHVLGHIELEERAAIVDGKPLAHELGHDGARPRPGLDGLAVSRVVGPVHLFEQSLVYVRALFERTSH